MLAVGMGEDRAMDRLQEKVAVTAVHLLRTHRRVSAHGRAVRHVLFIEHDADTVGGTPTETETQTHRHADTQTQTRGGGETLTGSFITSCITGNVPAFSPNAKP